MTVVVVYVTLTHTGQHLPGLLTGVSLGPHLVTHCMVLTLRGVSQMYSVQPSGDIFFSPFYKVNNNKDTLKTGSLKLGHNEN